MIQPPLNNITAELLQNLKTNCLWRAESEKSESEKSCPKEDVHPVRKPSIDSSTESSSNENSSESSKLDTDSRDHKLQGTHLYDEFTTTLSYECPHGHCWKGNTIQAKKDYVCQECLNNGATNSMTNIHFMENEIQLTCDNHHVWMCQYKKYILRICPTCSRLQKEERKATLLEDMKKEQEYYEKKQAELFQEARDSFIRRNYMSGVNPSLLSQIQSSLSSVLASAKAKAAEFIRSNNQGSLREEDIVALYKIILSPAELIQHEICEKNAEDKKSYYKKIALQIHPDKCSHPQAGEAFQKFTQIYRATSL